MIPLVMEDKIPDFLKKLENRQAGSAGTVRETVAEILESVKIRGDAAVCEYTRRFDGVDLGPGHLRIPESAIDSAGRSMPKGFTDILSRAAENIRQFHEKDKPASWMSWGQDGVLLGQRVTAMDRAGLYVPGGRAAYPSSLLMTAIPAQAAGVREIAVATPAGKDGVNPAILATARILGLSEVYGIGGAQAVAALAFGTETIRGVDKIAGPGNLYVAEAKRQVFGIVDIDMIAGPSEVLVLADGSADPGFVAADLLAQAEHDPMASAVCITHDRQKAEAVQKAVETLFQKTSRKEIIRASLSDWGAVLVTGNWQRAVELANFLAPEHLGLHVKNPWEVLGDIRHAGAVFIGHHSPETIGDYWAGPSHVLPTGRTARFASPLSASDFMKKSSLIAYTPQALRACADSVISFAEMEALDAHAEAIRRRIA
jgi:histidinol dehydrogenase